MSSSSSFHSAQVSEIVRIVGEALVDGELQSVTQELAGDTVIPALPGQSSVSGGQTVADFAALLALPSPADGALAIVTAPVISGGTPYTKWRRISGVWRLDSPQNLLMDFDPSAGFASTTEQVLKQYLLAPGLLNSLRYINGYVLFAKSGTTNAATQIGIRIGAAGTISDQLVCATGSFAAGNRQYAFGPAAHFPGGNVWRQIYSGGAGLSSAVGTGAAYPVNISVTPDFGSALYLSATVAMSGTTDIATCATVLFEAA